LPYALERVFAFERVTKFRLHTINSFDIFALPFEAKFFTGQKYGPIVPICKATSETGPKFIASQVSED